MTGKKNLIFALHGSNNDKSYALSDLNNIPKEYYSKYASMFQSLIAGAESYDSVHHKVSTGNNEKSSGIRKIKDFKTRLLYLPLDSDTVFVIGCYNKFNDNNIKSRNFEITRKSSVIEQHKHCKKLITAGRKGELVNNHLGYLQEIGDNLEFVVEGGELDEKSRTK